MKHWSSLLLIIVCVWVYTCACVSGRQAVYIGSKNTKACLIMSAERGRLKVVTKRMEGGYFCLHVSDCYLSC